MANRSSQKATDSRSAKGAARRSGAASGSKGAQRGRKLSSPPAEREHMLDERAHREILGIVFAVAALALFVVALLPTDALVSHVVSSFLRLAVGVGVYLVPLFLLVVGACFVVSSDHPKLPSRVAVGMALILFAVLVLVALGTPGVEPDDAMGLFDEPQLISRGGYLGAGVAWVGITLLGRPVSYIVMIGVVVIGLVVVGFSISKLIERMREKMSAGAGLGVNVPGLGRVGGAKDARADAPQGEDEDSDALPAKAFDVTRPHPRAARQRAAGAGEGASETQALPSARERLRTALVRSSQGGQDDGADASKTAAMGAAATRRIPLEDVKGQTQALTRRLGKAHAGRDDADGKASGAGAAPAAKAVSSAAGAANGTDAAEAAKGGFVLPPMSLLSTSKRAKKAKGNDAELQDTAACLQETLEDFGIMATVVGWVAGPTVTLYKVNLPAGVRVSRVTALQDDIALALAAPGVRIFAPIPGTNYVGIEVPNRTRQTVLLGDVLREAPEGPLQIAIGKDVEGNCIVSDLAKMPHLLIAGTTGSGKSVSIHGMIMSILMRATPDEVRFIMIDPKRVEFILYNGIPHLYVPVVTDPKEASSALSWGVAEMERRLKVFSKAGVRNIAQYNEDVREGRLEDEAASELPYIVIVIDELADLMMNVGKEVEFSISRIAQLARAAGIHLIIATQRPSTNVVTGLIKANITNRIALNVASSIDSRVILDAPGAEKLIGRGDLLLSKPEYAKPQRIQGCWVDDKEINAVVAMLKDQGEPEYHSEILSTNVITLGASAPDGSGGSGSTDDPRLWEAAEIVVSTGLGSTSNIQRRLSVGYSRAGRIMDMLEEKGIVGPPNGSKPREVLVDEMELETLKAFEENDAAQGGE